MTENTKVNVFRSAAILTVALLLGWVICFWPARLMDKQSGVFWMSVAATCCLIPGWIVVFLSGLAIFSNELTTMLVQTMVRMFTVGGVAIAVKKTKPEIGFADFYGWLVVFYLLALGVEVWMLRRTMNQTSSQIPGEQPSS